MEVGRLEKGPDGPSRGQPKRRAKAESDLNFARSDQRAKASLKRDKIAIPSVGLKTSRYSSKPALYARASFLKLAW